MNAILQPLFHPLLRLYWTVRSIGDTPELDSYERRKLAIFNLLNCFGLLNGIIIPLIGLFHKDDLPPLATVVAVSPAFISGLALAGTWYHKHEQAKMVYFIFYPFITALAYATNVDIGIELFFVGYGVLAIFLIRKLADAIIAFTFSVSLYLVVYTSGIQYASRLADTSQTFFVFNHVLALLFIFLSLYLFKTENNTYQLSLRKKNREIEQQKQEIAGQVVLLEQQTKELKELDGVKNKLFSVIAHDLKTPLYALRNLFTGFQRHDLPGNEIKAMLPDVVADLNYTTGLMENLLQWAKTQMQTNALKPQQLEVSELIREVMQLLRLQAESKSIYLENKMDQPVHIYADKDMINLVLRNLLSNAIKFTPENGSIYLGAHQTDSFVEVYVQDTGTGMNEETLKKVNTNDYFTTKGTANESGTGLGLMLCKEFLGRNGGRMFVESEPGKGTVFSFTLPSGRDDG
jgi:signal transduction histidine kinase